MKDHTATSTRSHAGRSGIHLLVLITATFAFSLASGTGSALASKQIVDYFGNPPHVFTTGSNGGEFSSPADVAVNNSGAGPAARGDIYVADGTRGIATNPRIQRFGRDDNGTPANPKDDSYFFISAWGAGVEAGGTNYEVCTVAASCKGGTISGGNGTLAGNGGLANPAGIAVDQDTGEVYVADRRNHSVSVYAGDGAFLRSFGFDVVEAGPDNAGTGYEVCVAANGDVCKAGDTGSGVGQIGEMPNIEGAFFGIAVSQPDGNPASGTVFLADSKNRRISSYGLDGSGPASIGSSANFDEQFPQRIAVDSRGIVYASDKTEIERYDSQGSNGGGVGFLSPLLGSSNFVTGLAVDPDTDGIGPDSDVLYVLNASSGHRVVDQYGPVNSPGLTVPPAAVDDTHATSSDLGSLGGLAVDESDGRLYVPADVGGGQKATGVYVLGDAIGGGAPAVSLDSLSDLSSHSVTVHGTIDPEGPPRTGYDLEYSTDGTTWESTPETPLGSQETPQSIEALLEPILGLEPNTSYLVRLVAKKRFLPPVVTSAESFTTLPSAPLIETTGSPVRTSTSARLEGRVAPRNSAATYHFEYGDQGPCDANPCTVTESYPAGSGAGFGLVSQQVTGLQPNTTYHYRVIADNGSPGSPVTGEDMTTTTYASDAPLSHGHLPGPPDSDRAWEQVNAPDTGGNPVSATYAISDDGSRAVYQVSGGAPDSEVGTIYDQLFAERTPSGWKTKSIYPLRTQATEDDRTPPAGRSDLSEMVIANFSTTGGADSPVSAWRISPTKPATLLYSVKHSEGGQNLLVSDNASRVIAHLSGSHDPEHPTAPGTFNLYDVSSGGTPRLVNLLPDGSVPACGVSEINAKRRSSHLVSGDGSWVFFPSQGSGKCAAAGNGDPVHLYARDMEAETTKLITTPAVSGPECHAALIKSTPGAVFFFTKTRLVAEDTAPEDCRRDGDVYRYDLGDGALSCVTCVVAGIDADVIANEVVQSGGPEPDVGVAEDGSRVYFYSQNRLRPGAISGEPNTYRIDVATGGLAFVGNIGAIIAGNSVSAMTPDGSVAVFRSGSSSLNAIGGQQNGGGLQYYRYDDRDRSLICVSCPTDGTAPRGGVAGPSLVTAPQLGPNLTPLDAAGDFVFSTPTPLAFADQNTAGAGQNPEVGTDIYEWRDGRLLLVSDGLTNWPINFNGVAHIPEVGGINPSGRDVFFTEAAQLTQDALDGYRRLYDARIGGGFEFPPPSKPCPLEVCQGIPKGAPEEAAPGTGSFVGPGNAQARHPKKKHRKKSHKRHAKKAHRKANSNRGAGR